MPGIAPPSIACFHMATMSLLPSLALTLYPAAHRAAVIAQPPQNGSTTSLWLVSDDITRTMSFAIRNLPPM